MEKGEPSREGGRRESGGDAKFQSFSRRAGCGCCCRGLEPVPAAASEGARSPSASRPAAAPPATRSGDRRADETMARVSRAEPSCAVPSRAEPHAGRRGGVCLPAAAARSRRGRAGRGGGSAAPPHGGSAELAHPPAAGTARGRLVRPAPFARPSASRLRGSGGGAGRMPRPPPRSLSAAAAGGRRRRRGEVPSAPHGKLKMIDVALAERLPGLPGFTVTAGGLGGGGSLSFPTRVRVTRRFWGRRGSLTRTLRRVSQV